MLKEELFLKLNTLLSDESVGITAYAVINSDKGECLKKLDIENKALPDLKEIFTKSLSKNIVKKTDLSVMKLSSSDERINTIYEYDCEIPEELNILENVTSTDSVKLFDFEKDNFSKIKTLIIEIGNNDHQVVLYKTMSPINIYGRKSYFLKAVKANKRFEKVNDEFIRISNNFQLMRIDDTLFVMDLKTIESLFGFHEIIKKEAAKGVSAIEKMLLVENPETLSELIDDVKYARKLTKVANNSPILKNKVPNSHIIKFSQSHPSLKGRIRYNADGNKIQLDTNVSKDLFLKLLSDDFLISELTKLYYDSMAKDGVVIKVDNKANTERELVEHIDIENKAETAH